MILRSRQQRPSASTFRSHGFALICMAAITVIYLLALLSSLTTALPGAGDHPDVATFVWNIGWIKQAIDSGGNLMQTDAVLIPFGADLHWHTYGLVQGLFAYPFVKLFGVIGGFNLMLTATLLANGLALYALVYDEVRHTPAALVAAGWAMLGTPVLFHLRVGRPSFASLWIVALALLSLKRLLARPTLGRSVTLGLLLAAALFSDFQILFYTILWLFLYGSYWWWTTGRDHLRGRHVLALSASALFVLLPFGLVFYPTLDAVGAGDYPRPGLNGMLLYSFNIQHYISPAIFPLAYGGYELFLSAVAAIVIFRWRGSYRFWLAGTVALLLLALGPYLQPTRIPLPFAAFSLWRPLGQFRTPGRLTMPALIGLAVTAGLLLAYLLPRLRSRWLVAAAAVILLVGRLFLALEQDPMEVVIYPAYAVYDQIAEEAGDFALLEVPVGLRSGLEQLGQGGEILQYYQHVHGKRLINGMIARLPSSVFAFYNGHPSLRFLSGEMPAGSTVGLAGDLVEVLEWSEARYVLLHRSLLDDEQVRRIETFLDNQPFLAKTGVERDLVVYRVMDG